MRRLSLPPACVPQPRRDLFVLSSFRLGTISVDRCCGRRGRRKQGGNWRPRAGWSCKYLAVSGFPVGPLGLPVSGSSLGSGRCRASPSPLARVRQVTSAGCPGGCGALFFPNSCIFPKSCLPHAQPTLPALRLGIVLRLSPVRPWGSAWGSAPLRAQSSACPGDEPRRLGAFARRGSCGLGNATVCVSVHVSVHKVPAHQAVGGRPTGRSGGAQAPTAAAAPAPRPGGSGPPRGWRCCGRRERTG